MKTIKNRPSVFYALLGHIYEHYENTLFTFVAPFMAVIFFPHFDPQSSRMAIYSAVATGFITRPFGAFIFSWIGDKYGRRKALIYSVTSCIIPSLLIGLLPSYAVVGIWATILLFIARLIQGVSVGGGFYATLTFVSESTEASKKNLFLGITLSMGFLGAILGTLSSSYFMSDAFPSWGWRVPFLICVIYGLILFSLKSIVTETKEWSASSHNTPVPFIEAVRLYPENIFATLFFGMSLLLPFYIVASWLPGYIMDTFHISTSENLQISSLLMLTSGLCIVLCAWLLTWIKEKTILRASGAVGLLCFILLLQAMNCNSYKLILLTQFCGAIYTALLVAPGLSLVQKLFPIKCRFSGFAIPFSMGQATLIGSTPLLCEIISTRTQNPANVSYLFLLTIALVLLGAFLANPLKEEVLESS